MRADPPQEAVVKVSSIVKKMNDAYPDVDLETPLSLCGRVANSVVWEQNHWEVVAKKMRKPSWIFDSRSITNSKEVLRAGLNYWLIGDGTKTYPR